MIHSYRKTLAYIISNNKLLVFKHRDYAEAGVQVPAGTVESGESVEKALYREILEETGILQSEQRLVKHLKTYLGIVWI